MDAALLSELTPAIVGVIALAYVAWVENTAVRRERADLSAHMDDDLQSRFPPAVVTSLPHVAKPERGPGSGQAATIQGRTHG